MSNPVVTRVVIIYLMCIAFGLIVYPLSADDKSLENIGLSREEIVWLEKHPTIRVGGPRAFPPFHYFEKDGTVQGIASDYTNILMEKLGISVEMLVDRPWPEVLQKANDREIDMIACAAKTADREIYLIFSHPYLSFPMVIISRKDAPFIGGLEDLHGKVVAVILEVSTYEWLMKDRIDITPRFVHTPLKALESVSLGDSDAYIGNLAASSYLIEKNGLANLKIAAPTTYGNYELYFAVRSDWPELVSIINKALAAMRPEQHSAIRNRWISVRYEYGLRAVDILKWVLLVACAAAALLTGIMIWNRKLKREVENRKKAEAALKEALTKVKTLSGFLPICASCKKIRDDKGYWKQIESYISEHSDAEFSHSICPDCLKKLYPELSDKDRI